MITNCITCKTKLIPVVHGVVNPDMLEMQDRGILLISLDQTNTANSYCQLCEEAYGDYTDFPVISN